ncbi:sulfate ABC transporter substrate-binding protein [Eubacterium xylanophilum]|uniref:sulfate ABC transporter substrate-binding protein n=1 Tax=Eubacterium xylanophilum TaxID=39497 RepID=UPI0004B6FE68
MFNLKQMKRIGAMILVGTLAVGSMTACGKSGEEKKAADGKVRITNVSYDPTRELYQEYNKKFAEYYKKEKGKDVEIVQSHGGSGGQARSVVEGAEADVVTLALAHDITLVEQAGLIEPGWLGEFDKNSSPYTSTIVFLVRKGNAKGIKDWDDLIKDGVQIITPDPKSSGGACWNFLAAWQFAKEKFGGDEAKIKDFVKKIYDNVTVMDSGARGSTTTFVENGQGDVLLAWENEAIATVKEYPNDYEIISPSISILAQPSVAIVDENAKKDGVTEVAKDYLNYLYTDDAQKIIGDNGYRPSNEEILKNYKDVFNLDMKLCTIDDFGGWDKAYETFFQDGKIFDEIHSK